MTRTPPHYRLFEELGNDVCREGRVPAPIGAPPWRGAAYEVALMSAMSSPQLSSRDPGTERSLASPGGPAALMKGAKPPPRTFWQQPVVGGAMCMPGLQCGQMMLPHKPQNSLPCPSGPCIPRNVSPPQVVYPLEHTYVLESGGTASASAGTSHQDYRYRSASPGHTRSVSPVRVDGSWRGSSMAAANDQAYGNPASDRRATSAPVRRRASLALTSSGFLGPASASSSSSSPPRRPEEHREPRSLISEKQGGQQDIVIGKAVGKPENNLARTDADGRNGHMQNRARSCGRGNSMGDGNCQRHRNPLPRSLSPDKGLKDGWVWVASRDRNLPPKSVSSNDVENRRLKAALGAALGKNQAEDSEIEKPPMFKRRHSSPSALTQALNRGSFEIQLQSTASTAAEQPDNGRACSAGEQPPMASCRLGDSMTETPRTESSVTVAPHNDVLSRSRAESTITVPPEHISSLQHAPSRELILTHYAPVRKPILQDDGSLEDHKVELANSNLGPVARRDASPICHATTQPATAAPRRHASPARSATSPPMATAPRRDAFPACPMSPPVATAPRTYTSPSRPMSPPLTTAPRRDISPARSLSPSAAMAPRRDTFPVYSVSPAVAMAPTRDASPLWPRMPLPQVDPRTQPQLWSGIPPQWNFGQPLSGPWQPLGGNVHTPGGLWQSEPYRKPQMMLHVQTMPMQNSMTELNQVHAQCHGSLLNGKSGAYLGLRRERSAEPQLAPLVERDESPIQQVAARPGTDPLLPEQEPGCRGRAEPRSPSKDDRDALKSGLTGQQIIKAAAQGKSSVLRSLLLAGQLDGSRANVPSQRHRKKGGEAKEQQHRSPAAAAMPEKHTGPPPVALQFAQRRQGTPNRCDTPPPSNKNPFRKSPASRGLRRRATELLGYHPEG